MTARSWTPLLGLVALLLAGSLAAVAKASGLDIVAMRCPLNPLITPELSPGLGTNINGPSVIRAPDWLPNRLGRYYMYFASHHGQTIRLAYADALCGRWTIYEPGSLRLDQATEFINHIASPDVHVDHHHQEIRMYFHGRHRERHKGQRTGLAISTDGLNFAVVQSDLGHPYFRVFSWDNSWYALAKQRDHGGMLYRSPTAIGPYRAMGLQIARMRHAAVLPWPSSPVLFFSRIGDQPERILAAALRPGEDRRQPLIGTVTEVLAPAESYEGVDLPISRSRSGSTRRARQLRDPAVLEDEGRLYLFYSLAGESGIGLAELTMVHATDPSSPSSAAIPPAPIQAIPSALANQWVPR